MIAMFDSNLCPKTKIGHQPVDYHHRLLATLYYKRQITSKSAKSGQDSHRPAKNCLFTKPLYSELRGVSSFISRNYYMLLIFILNLWYLSFFLFLSQYVISLHRRNKQITVIAINLEDLVRILHSLTSHHFLTTPTRPLESKDTKSLHGHPDLKATEA